MFWSQLSIRHLSIVKKCIITRSIDISLAYWCTHRKERTTGHSMQRVLEAKGHLLKKSTESERDEGAAQADEKIWICLRLPYNKRCLLPLGRGVHSFRTNLLSTGRIPILYCPNSNKGDRARLLLFWSSSYFVISLPRSRHNFTKMGTMYRISRLRPLLLISLTIQ